MRRDDEMPERFIAVKDEKKKDIFLPIKGITSITFSVEDGNLYATFWNISGWAGVGGPFEDGAEMSAKLKDAGIRWEELCPE